MLVEIEMDEANGCAYVSTRLNSGGCESWPAMLRQAATDGNDESLEHYIERDECLNSHYMRVNHRTGISSPISMPVNAAENLAQGEFNRFYIRGLCRFAIEKDIPFLVGYRARYSENPRSSSEEAVGHHFNPQAVLDDLRTTQGQDTQLKMPGGPGSGISLRLP
jgi:hypothetical protein